MDVYKLQKTCVKIRAFYMAYSKRQVTIMILDNGKYERPPILE